MDIGIKDLRLIQQLAQGARLPALEAALESMEEIVLHPSSGDGPITAAAQIKRGEDWCALARTVEQRLAFGVS